MPEMRSFYGQTEERICEHIQERLGMWGLGVAPNGDETDDMLPMNPEGDEVDVSQSVCVSINDHLH